MSEFDKRPFSQRAGVRDPEFKPFEPSKPFPWPFVAIILALVAWGAATLYMDGRWASSATLERMGLRVAERQVSETAQADPSATPKPLPGHELFGDYCATCHQANGAGVRGAIPPLNKSRYAQATPEVPIAIVLRGLIEPIEVNGTVYTGRMPSFGDTLSDDEIAALLSYVRQAWENDAGTITSGQVAELRAALLGGPVEPLRGGAELEDLFGISIMSPVVEDLDTEETQ